MNFARNVAGVLLTSAVGIPLGFATSVVLARFLSVDDRGSYAVLTTFAFLVTIFVQLGLPTAAVFRIRRVQADPASVATTGLVFLVCVGAVFIAGAVALQPLISEHLLEGAPAQVFYLVLPIIPMQLLVNLFGSIARALDRFRYANWYGFGINALTLALLVRALVIGGGALPEALVAIVVARGILTTGLVIVVLRVTGISFRSLGTELRQGLRFGLKSYTQGLAGRLHERVDIFMLALLLSEPAQVALYAIAVGLSKRVAAVPEAIAKAAYPQFAGLGREEAARFACAVSRQAISSAVVLAVLLAAVAPYFLPLVYGEPYAGSVLPFTVLLPGVACVALYSILSRYFTSIDRQGANIFTQTIGAVINVILNLWLIPRFGILGAAISTLASYTVQSAIISSIFISASGHSVREMLLIRVSDLDAIRRRFTQWLNRLRERG